MIQTVGIYMIDLLLIQSKYNKILNSIDKFQDSHTEMQENPIFMEEIVPKCKYSNQADLFCLSDNCEHNPFVCLTKKCACMTSLHKKCTMTRFQSILQQMNTKRKKVPQKLMEAFNAIDEIYLDMMDRLSEQRQSLKQWIQNFGLSDQQVWFVNMLKDGKFDELKGRQIKNIAIGKNRGNIIPKFQKDDVNQYWNEINHLFYSCCQKIQLFSKVGLPIKSKILTLNEQLKLRTFLNAPVHAFIPLYRATENNFSAVQFHKKCDGKGDTITIIQNQWDFVFGGYTPIPWCSSLSGQYKHDYDSKTFIFSLTMGQKFELLRPLNAIMCRNDYGPTFGAGYDIHISNGSNFNNYSFTDFPHSFNNGHYKNSQNTYKQFSGVPDGCNMRLKQWQVFQIIWAQPEIQEVKQVKNEEQPEQEENMIEVPPQNLSQLLNQNQTLRQLQSQQIKSKRQQGKQGEQGEQDQPSQNQLQVDNIAQLVQNQQKNETYQQRQKIQQPTSNNVQQQKKQQQKKEKIQQSPPQQKKSRAKKHR